MNRRDVLIGGAAFSGALALSLPAQAATARREFRILRGGSDIGRHALQARLEGGRFEIDIDIDIAVKFLGITAYRYELTNREVWSGGRIESVRTDVNDDGERAFARLSRSGDLIEIDGSGNSGTAPVEAVTTSYYARPFIERRPWISTQSGRLIEIDADRGPGRPERWNISGELETSLIYDRNGEWIGCEFDAGGEPASYEIIGETGAITELWQSA